MSMPYPIQLSYEDWLRGWKGWANTRKRGKMAQFIVDKLEQNKQARWLDISVGKFELTEWHTIADEWFREKPRNSDQVDAPCMLRKGLPRAFPGLDEVKSESIKEGTQYRSRVFQAPIDLVREVLLHITNRGYLPNSVAMGNSVIQPFTTAGYPVTTSSSHPMVNGLNGGPVYSPDGYGVQPVTNMTTHSYPHVVKMEDTYSMVDSPLSDCSVSPYAPHQYPYDQQYQQQPQYGTGLEHIASAIVSASTSPGPYSATSNTSPYSTLDRGSSPYEGASPHYPNPSSVGQTLQVPPADDGWSGSNSPIHYSPEPSPDITGYSAPVEMPPQASPIPQMGGSPQPFVKQELIQVKPYPNKSPLEGGGQLVLVFNAELPPGNKWVSFMSTRPEYSTTVEAYQENLFTLVTIIPKHEIPETVLVQVVCTNHVLATTEFLYYANPQYQSELIFQFLHQNLPTYFQQADLMGAGGGMMGGGGGGGGIGGYGYIGNIPASTYCLLVGACRLGLEPLVYATLKLPSMQKITAAQITKAASAALEFGHHTLSGLLRDLVPPTPAFRARGVGEEDPTSSPIFSKTLEQLDKGGETHEEGAAKVLGQLVETAKRVRQEQQQREAEKEAEKEAEVPGTSRKSPPPSKEAEPEGEETEPEKTSYRRASGGKLQRQPKSVIEYDEDDYSPPSSSTQEDRSHGRPSLGELDDELPPLPRQRFTTGSFRSSRGKMLMAAYSDADSAVSMSFDRDEMELEIQRRNSSSICSSGLFSLNMSDQGVDVNIDPQAGDTFANSLSYENVYLVTEDYPPGEVETNKIFKAGDRIVAIGDTQVRGMGPEDFAELLQREASRGSTVRILPRLSPPPSSFVDPFERRLVRHHSEQQLDSITRRVSSLLSMKSNSSRRRVSIPSSQEGYGFKMIGGNAVGLFVSDVRPSRRELQPGDQILEINGQSTQHMTHFEASQLLRRSKDKVHLIVTENTARFSTVREQFEFDSFYLRSQIDHNPSDSREMRMRPGSLLRVVNTILYDGNHWLAWNVDEETGMETELRRIPSPLKAKHQYKKDAYLRLKQPSLSLPKEDRCWETVSITS